MLRENASYLYCSFDTKSRVNSKERALKPEIRINQTLQESLNGPSPSRNKPDFLRNTSYRITHQIPSL